MHLTGRTVRFVRLNADLQVKELAALIDITPNYLTMIERDKCPLTSRVQRRIEQIFGLSGIA